MRKPRNTFKFRLPAILLAAALVASACSGLNQAGSATPNPTAPPTAANGGQGTPVGTATPAIGPVTLSVWLPPQFNPAGGDLAASILQARLDEFTDRHPNTRIDVRLKAESGEGGLYAALSSAQSAASLALPDLVLMPGGLLPQVANEGLLRPLNDVLSGESGDDWYPFAQDLLAETEPPTSIPFVGDGLVLVYRPTAIETPPRTWQETLDSQTMLGFAAADPMAAFTLSEVLSQSGETSALNQATDLDTDALATVFDLYTQGNSRAIFPFWLAQFTTHEQSWQAFVDGRLPMVAAWSSLFIKSVESSEYAAAPLPTSNGEAFTLVKAWGWAVTSPSDARASLAAELAVFLSDPTFLAQWSAAAGYLPARASALAAWAPDARQALASQVLPNARLLPADEVRGELGEPISQAVIALLKQEVSPNQAMQIVLDGIGLATETP